MLYVQDAFTTSDRFPNAQAFDPDDLDTTALGSEPFDYIRNSVKITVDAYDGTMHFYISRPGRPDRPRLCRGLPQAVRADRRDARRHPRPLRVPEELFNVQTRMFGRYHVTNAQQFFRTDDLWTVPAGQTSEQTLPSEAYYVEMRLPGRGRCRVPRSSSRWSRPTART